VALSGPSCGSFKAVEGIMKMVVENERYFGSTSGGATNITQFHGAISNYTYRR